PSFAAFAFAVASVCLMTCVGSTDSFTNVEASGSSSSSSVSTSKPMPVGKRMTPGCAAGLVCASEAARACGDGEAAEEADDATNVGADSADDAASVGTPEVDGLGEGARLVVCGEATPGSEIGRVL